MRARVATWVMWAAITTAALSAGCSPETSTGGCTRFTRDEIAFPQQTATGSIHTGPTDWPIVEENPPPDHECRAYLSMPSGPCGAKRGPPPLDMYVQAGCSLGGRLYWGFDVTLGDVRDLAVGAHAMPATSWVTAAPSATLHVDSTTGTSGEYPNVISPDFAKSLRVEVVSDSFDASLGFELKADQFEARPGSSCQSCAL